MEFLLHFHVNSNQKSKLVKLLENYSGIRSVVTKRRTDDLLDNILADTNADPDYYVVNQSSRLWQSVECNSFKKLHNLGSLISKKLETIFIQTLYCSEGKYAYFLVYDRGSMTREIEGTGITPMPRINQGRVLPFETRERESGRANKIRLFDLDSIADYCLQMGIDISNLHNEYYSVVLEGKRKGEVLYHIERDKLRALWDIEREAKKICMEKRKESGRS